MLLRLLGLLALIAVLFWYAGERGWGIHQYLKESSRWMRESVAALQDRVAGVAPDAEVSATDERDEAAGSRTRDDETGPRSRRLGVGSDVQEPTEQRDGGETQTLARSTGSRDIQEMLDEGVVASRFQNRVGSASTDASPRSGKPEVPARVEDRSGNTETFEAAYGEASAKLTRALKFLEGRGSQ